MILKQAEQFAWRLAEFDEAAARANWEADVAKWRDKASKLNYVTPQPGTTLAVGPQWSGSVPTGHPNHIPGQAAKDDIHGYLNHEPSGYVNFIWSQPMMRRNGIGAKLLDHAGISDTAHAINKTPDGKAFFKGLGLT
jgi:hypothetical protein